MGMASRTWVVSVVSIIAGLAVCGALRAQSPLKVIGEPLWGMENGLCRYTLAGDTKIMNLAAAEYLSGSLRLSVAMTSNPFPDSGELVSFVDIGQLQGGYEMANASTTAPITIPPVTGFRVFTLVLEEFIGSGWFTHYAGTSRLSYLKEGVEAPPPLWNPAKGRVIPLPVRKPTGMKMTFNQKAVQFGGRIQVMPKFNQLSLSAKLNRSERTVVYIGSDAQGTGGDWSYKSGYAKWKGKTQPVGTLVIDYGLKQGSRRKSTFWLFFQKEGRGFCKATHVEGKNSVTAWGMFTLQ